MPATRSQIRRPKLVDHTIGFGDGASVTFTFDANKLTDAWMDEWQQAERDPDTSLLNLQLADLIERWDILETDDGPPVPVTAEEIGKLFSLRDKLELIREFVGLPSDAEGNASRNTSSTPSTASTSTPEPRRNGQPPSETPAPSESRSSPHPI